MYQVIDEHDDEELAQRPVLSVLPFVIGAILAGLVFFGVWLMSPEQKIAPGQTVETPASREAYLKALAEPNPAVRRARLMDYQRVHPDTDRNGAIADQLDVINAAELSDWAELTQAIYDERAPLGERRTALVNYEMRWNGQLLGGRGEELEELRTILDETKIADTLPDRSMTPGDSPISEEIPADVLAGAPPQMAVLLPLKEAEPPIRITTPNNIVVQPRVRRNVSPNYPRSAKRRNIGAIVVVSMDINERGRVESVETLENSAERYARDFRKEAERAAKRTRFHPKTINGEAVPAVGVRKRYIFKSN